MFFLKMLAAMRAHRCSTHRYDEEGAEITRRLLELLDATKLEQVETLPAIAVSGGLPQSRRLIESKER